MKYALEEQVSMFGPDTWSGKTSPAHSAATAAKTSRQSSRKSSGSSSRMPLTCLCLTRGGWNKAGCLYGELGNWSVAYRVHDAQYWGVPQRRKRIVVLADFNGLSAPEILFDPQLGGEAPDGEPDEAVPNSGAGRKPEILHFGSGLQRHSDESGAAGEGTSGGASGSPGGPEKLSFQERAGKPGGAREYSCSGSGPEPCQPSITNPSSTDAYSIQGNTIDRDAKQNGGISRNRAHTLNGVDRHAVCAVDCRNGTENPFVNGTLQAKEQGQNLNSNNVVRVPAQAVSRTQG